MNETGDRYDKIGDGYAGMRREDPTLRFRIEDALAGTSSLVNIGAGTGSYEPTDRFVVAVEPSDTMVRQRGANAAPVARAVAAYLPFADDTFDAALTVLSLHHWHPRQRQGIDEMARVASKRLVIVTIDAMVSGNMWLMADYLHEVRNLDHEIFPTPREICDWVPGRASIDVVPIPADTPDRTLMSFWAHPERVLDPAARNATSGFARQSPDVVARVVKDVTDDLESGAWDAKYGYLRELDEFDAGLRLLTIDLGG